MEHTQINAIMDKVTIYWQINGASAKTNKITLINIHKQIEDHISNQYSNTSL